MIICTMLCSVLCFTGCSISGNSKNAGAEKEKKGIKTYTSYFGSTGAVLSDNNTVQELIAEKTGARCIETWLSPKKTVEEEVGEMIIAGKYPDFLFGGLSQQKLLEANALIPLDEYWDDYDNIRNYLDEKTWNSIRSKDGHIYFIPPFNNVYMYDTSTVHDSEAFWIQVKVLKWAGYPQITTLDEYFDVLERYLAANPADENGNANIGYEILSDGYFYFCLENPPQFLDGYPNDGCCIVDGDKLQAVDYNTTDTARRWFKKLNDEYHKGLIDPEWFVLTSDQYKSKIASGNVLGMVDQRWNFIAKERELPDECKYVPIGVVIDKGIEGHYRSNPQIDVSQGIGITVSCDDTEGALDFLNKLLDPEILTLRSWGIKNVNYSVDSNGLYYRTDEQRQDAANAEYAAANLCSYGYFPNYIGMDHDGINAFSPQNQPSEFYNQLSDIMKECFSAYNVQTYSELLNKPEKSSDWFPMWSYTNTFTPDTDYGKAKDDVDILKHQYLPKVVMSDDFDVAWDEYMQAYNTQWDKDTYFNALTAEIRRRSSK